SDTNLRNVVALSATPGPPALITKVPEGNLAARISISPEGTKPGEPGGSENRGGTSSAGRGGAASAGAAAGSSSLPAAVSVSGGVEPHTSSGGAGAGLSGRLDLTPKEPYQPTPKARPSGRIDTSRLAPGSPPEKILSGSEIYTMHVN